MPSQAKKRKKYARYDWIAIRAEYVQGNESLRDLAAKHSVNLGRIGERAAREGWAEERERFRNDLQTRTEEKIKDELSTQMSQDRIRVIGVIDSILEQGERQLHGVKDAAGNWVVIPTMKIRAGDLLEAGKLKLVLLGEIIDRKELKGDGFNVNVFDWRALADKYGLTEQDVIAEAKRLVEALESAVDSSRVESHRQEKEV